MDGPTGDGVRETCPTIETGLTTRRQIRTPSEERLKVRNDLVVLVSGLRGTLPQSSRTPNVLQYSYLGVLLFTGILFGGHKSSRGKKERQRRSTPVLFFRGRRSGLLRERSWARVSWVWDRKTGGLGTPHLQTTTTGPDATKHSRQPYLVLPVEGFHDVGRRGQGQARRGRGQTRGGAKTGAGVGRGQARRGARTGAEGG